MKLVRSIFPHVQQLLNDAFMTAPEVNVRELTAWDRISTHMEALSFESGSVAYDNIAYKFRDFLKIEFKKEIKMQDASSAKLLDLIKQGMDEAIIKASADIDLQRFPIPISIVTAHTAKGEWNGDTSTSYIFIVRDPRTGAMFDAHIIESFEKISIDLTLTYRIIYLS